ncbi:MULTISPECIES: hypothetical protein [unclassified Lysinibacillus]|uniref:hypothetical protein n=1 Tax=unclassified Lysinibacillus TaxID=2636778 RepID=UPI0038129661
MSNCPNCLAINPFKKVHRDGAEIEICEYCNTIKEEEREEYTENQVQNKEDADPIFTVAIGYFAGVLFFVILIIAINN